MCPRLGFSSLIAAVYNRNATMCAALLHHPGCNVNCTGRGGLTPLMYAAQAGDETLVAALLRAGADRHAVNQRRETALDIARKAMREKVGEGVDSAIASPLTIAPGQKARIAPKPRLGVAGKLFGPRQTSNGPEPDASAASGPDGRRFKGVIALLVTEPQLAQEVLHAAAAHGDATRVRVLCAQGMSPMTCARVRSDLGWHHELHTPLIAACAHRRPSTARALLSAVVGRSDRDDGRAAERGAILASAFVNAENSVGQTALMYAARVGSEELTLWLLREGADRYHADRFGHTALDHALHQRSRPIAPSLPPASPPKERPSPRSASSATPSTLPPTPLAIVGAQPLHDEVIAALRYDPEACSLPQLAMDADESGVTALVKQGADVNGHKSPSAVVERAMSAVISRARARGSRRLPPPPPTPAKECPHSTPLIAACAASRLNVVRVLLAHPDCDVDRVDEQMWTPLMHASAVGFEEGVIALLRSGADRYCGTTDDKGQYVDAAALAARGPVAHVAVAGILAADPQRRSPHGAAADGQLAVLEGFAKQGEDMGRAAPTLTERSSVAPELAWSFNKDQLASPVSPLNVVDGYGRGVGGRGATPLIIASAAGHQNAVRRARAHS